MLNLYFFSLFTLVIFMNMLVVFKMLEWLTQGWRLLGEPMVFLKMAWVIKGLDTNWCLFLVLESANNPKSFPLTSKWCLLMFFCTHSTRNMEGSKESKDLLFLRAAWVIWTVHWRMASKFIFHFLQFGKLLWVMDCSWDGLHHLYILFSLCVFLLNVYLCVKYTREVFLSSLL